MKVINNKQLILSLIKGHLINAKLINGLNEMGINADNYFLNLSDTIFNLMKFEDNEETERIFERYLELTGRVNFIDITKAHNLLDDIASQIYTELSTSKKFLHRVFSNLRIYF